MKTFSLAFPLSVVAFLCSFAAIPTKAQQPIPPKELLLWQKLETTIHETDKNLDGILGVHILDLTTSHSLSLNADETFPTASTIKIAILAELFRQAQQGKLNLSDSHTLQSSDLVGGSGIAGALTPGVTKLTLRDVAALMISVSDNSMTNVIIDRVGMQNVNALLDSLGLTHTRIRRKMMDIKAASDGRENVSTPREISQLLEALYRGKILNNNSPTTSSISSLFTRKVTSRAIFPKISASPISPANSKVSATTAASSSPASVLTPSA